MESEAGKLPITSYGLDSAALLELRPGLLASGLAALAKPFAYDQVENRMQVLHRLARLGRKSPRGKWESMKDTSATTLSTLSA